MIKVSEKDFNDFVLKLAERYEKDRFDFVERDMFPIPHNASDLDVHEFVNRCLVNQILEHHTECEWKILPSVLELAKNIKNLPPRDYPPPRDYWKEVTVWFRAKPWSLPIIGFVVIIPVLLGLCQLLRYIFEWFGQRQ
ncbi:MAG: hypothetical protein ACRC46_11385 [Thermoguttaceae bacterium]